MVTTADVSQILAALSALTDRVNSAMEQLARIEERTSVLADHELRIRAAEDAARVAGETAASLKAQVAAHAVTILELKRKQDLAGKFSIGTIGTIAVTMITATVSIMAIVVTIHNWN